MITKIEENFRIAFMVKSTGHKIDEPKLMRMDRDSILVQVFNYRSTWIILKGMLTRLDILTLSYRKR